MKRQDGKDAPVIQLSRKGLGIWILVFFLVAVWTFVIGLLVGRGMAPVRFDMQEIHHQLAEIREEILKQEEERLPLDHSMETAGHDLDFYEDLKKEESETPLTGPAPAKPAGKAPGAAVAVKQATAPTPAAGKYTIQVASLQSAEMARDMVDKLKSTGYPAYQRTAEISGTTWYRVRIGEFATREAAGEMFKKLSGDGYKGILVVW
jgi:DedD protein